MSLFSSLSAADFIAPGSVAAIHECPVHHSLPLTSIPTHSIQRFQRPGHDESIRVQTFLSWMHTNVGSLLLSYNIWVRSILQSRLLSLKRGVINELLFQKSFWLAKLSFVMIDVTSKLVEEFFLTLPYSIPLVACQIRYLCFFLDIWFVCRPPELEPFRKIKVFEYVSSLAIAVSRLPQGSVLEHLLFI